MIIYKKYIHTTVDNSDIYVVLSAFNNNLLSSVLVFGAAQLTMYSLCATPDYY